jgi:hypothetical protein
VVTSASTRRELYHGSLISRVIGVAGNAGRVCTAWGGLCRGGNETAVDAIAAAFSIEFAPRRYEPAPQRHPPTAIEMTGRSRLELTIFSNLRQIFCPHNVGRDRSSTAGTTLDKGTRTMAETPHSHQRQDEGGSSEKSFDLSSELSVHPTIAALEKAGEPTVVIRGFLGASTDAGVRVYESLDLESYIDVPKSAIVHAEKDEVGERGAVRIHVRATAEITRIQRSLITAQHYNTAFRGEYRTPDRLWQSMRNDFPELVVTRESWLPRTMIPCTPSAIMHLTYRTASW